MGSSGVAIAALLIVICLKMPFSDGLGGLGFGLSVELWLHLTIVFLLARHSLSELRLCS